MWKKDNKNQVETSSVNSISILGSGLKLDGDLEAANDIRIDGTVLGNISCHKKIMVGETGKVTGDIHALEVHVMGEVLGDIFSAGPATIGAAAKVKGSIISARIQIDLGADIEGTLTKTGANKEELSRRLGEHLRGNKGKDTPPPPEPLSLEKTNKAKQASLPSDRPKSAI